MRKQQFPLHHLGEYLPPGCLEDILGYLQEYKIHLTITRARSTILGNYRNSYAGQNHRITVNGNLNKYAFLITLLHELAHLLTYEHFGNRVQAHGTEWKNEYSKILARFLLKKIFPQDIQRVLMRTLQNPAASSCADDDLLRVLHKYDSKPENAILVESLPIGAFFATKDKRVFRKDEKLRKRFKCTEISTGKIYLFSPVYEVFIVEKKL